jgi:hypothetical protein
VTLRTATANLRICLVALVALVALALRGGSAIGQAPSASPASATALGGAGAGNVKAALDYAPPSAESLGFTDWAAIRQGLGADDITGDSPIDDKLRVLYEVGRTQGAGAGFAISRYRDHRDSWGWDSLDLDWEAEIGSFGNPPVFVLRFRDGFDLAGVESRFLERGFSSEEIEGATLYSHEIELSQDWFLTTELAIANTAFLADGRTLVLSPRPGAVREVLVQLGNPAARPASDLAVAGALSGASGAYLLMGPDVCTRFNPERQRGATQEQIERLIQEIEGAGPLHTYASLGVGTGEQWPSTGRIAFGYLDPATAEQDLAPRRTVAETAMSLQEREPYSEAVFTVADATADEGMLLLAVDPVDDLAQRLIRMIQNRDMLFAGCDA